jgi:methionyl-tRNA formyltransferase
MARWQIIFMGTPELARVSLQALLAAPDLAVVAVVTQADKPKGRDLKIQFPPVKELALAHQLPVLQPDRARNEPFILELEALRPDLIVVAAYGQILPARILDLPRYGCINVHTSLLPKYRGAAPIQWAILNDESQTGVSIMKMDVGMDTGPVLAQQTTPIEQRDNAQTLHDRLALLGADLLIRTIPGFISGALPPAPQPAEGVSYAPKIKKTDGLIRWEQPARMIWNRVRGLIPWPGAMTHWVAAHQSALLKIWEAEPIAEQAEPGRVLRADKSGIVVGCGQGALRILVLQREGGRRLSAQAFLAGHPIQPGETLGT